MSRTGSVGSEADVHARRLCGNNTYTAPIEEKTAEQREVTAPASHVLCIGACRDAVLPEKDLRVTPYGCQIYLQYAVTWLEDVTDATWRRPVACHPSHSTDHDVRLFFGRAHGARRGGPPTGALNARFNAVAAELDSSEAAQRTVQNGRQLRRSEQT